MTDSQSNKYQGTCHCGTIGFQITERPQWLTDCNCSICRRLAPLWGHIDSTSFSLAGEGATISYMHGDRTLAFHTCTTCGCTTHWENHHPDYDHMAVNFRMCSPEVVATFRITYRFNELRTKEPG